MELKPHAYGSALALAVIVVADVASPDIAAQSVKNPPLFAVDPHSPKPFARV